MSDTTFNTIEDILDYIKTTDLEYATIGYVDYQGAIRSKYVSQEHLISALQGTTNPIITLIFDAGDEVLETASLGNKDETYNDSPFRLDPSSARIVPWENSRRNLLILGEFIEEGAQFCPRSLYNRLYNQCQEKGLTFVNGIELEFTLFDETSKSAADKNWRGIYTATRQKTYCSYQRQLSQLDFYHDLMDICKTLNINIDSLHEESGDGFMEVALAHGSGSRIPDNAILFKTFCKVAAVRHDKLATFMARWSNDADGQSGHIHMSITDQSGKNIFHDDTKEHQMSDAMRYFIGGLQKLLPEFLLMMAPNINSFKRLIPGIFAPISAEWGIENRTCSLRAIPGSKNSSRVECRTPGADANPYLSLSAMMGAGIYGIEHKIEPTASTTTNAYNSATPEALKFPSDFRDAIEKFSGSKIAREIFGDPFVDAYAQSRRTQFEQFQTFVTDKELERFFDLV